VDTVFDVPGDEEARRAYRRRLGVNLERIRTTLTRYTQETIADELGVDTETYARWERGSREPKAYDLHRIADVYGVPPEWLVEPTDSLTEIDRRLAALRQVAAEAAAREAGEGPAQPGDAGTAARPGKRRADKQPRSPQ
jgi:transcriptional regulator with XRE-family HTH domain